MQAQSSTSASSSADILRQQVDPARPSALFGGRLLARSGCDALMDRGGDDLLGGDAGRRQLGGDAALAHHQHAVAEVRELLGVAGVEQDRAALAGEAGP